MDHACRTRCCRGLRALTIGVVLGSTVLAAQEAPGVQELRDQLQQLQKAFEQSRLEHQRQMDALRRQIDALSAAATNAPAPTSGVVTAPSGLITPVAPPPPTAAAEPKPVPVPAKPWSPTDPLTLAGGQQSYVNLSFDAVFAVGGSTAEDVEALQPGGHDPHQDGFNVQSLEMVLNGKVDPYFTAQASLVFQIDPNGESTFEVEEAYAETLSLPANLKVKAGVFFTPFGRMNPTHPHSWTFVDSDLVNALLLGPDGLRNPGVEVSWLMPAEFYSELFLAVQNSNGETAWSFRNPSDGDLIHGRPPVDRPMSSFADMLFAPRYAVSFELTDTQTLLAGASGAVGPNNSGEDTRTSLVGLDFFWKWRPTRQHGGYPFVTWQTEGIARNYEAAAYTGVDLSLPRENLWDYGFYSQVAWGFRQGWVAALRGDYFNSLDGSYADDPQRIPRWRLSPNMSYYPSEFSRLRLQFNLDHREGIGLDQTVWLQFEFLLGAHAAHSF